VLTNPDRPDMSDPVECRRLRLLVRALPPWERLIIRSLYGFNHAPCSHRQLARALAMPIISVERYEQAGLERLRAFYLVGSERSAA